VTGFLVTMPTMPQQLGGCSYASRNVERAILNADNFLNILDYKVNIQSSIYKAASSNIVTVFILNSTLLSHQKYNK